MKPMLAAATDGTNLRYPLILSPKLDGVRALVINGIVMSRSLKPIPNPHVQRLFGRREFEGFDGELIVGEPNSPDVYRRTTSGVMRLDGQPDVKFHVFDRFTYSGGFIVRLATFRDYVYKVVLSGLVRVVDQIVVNDEEELLKYETAYLADGYEGVMLRDPNGAYKHGRSTLNEGGMMKLKRFEDSEALVLGMQELMSNTNEAVTNALGHKERSTKKEGMVGANKLGALHVKDMRSGVTFDIGTGFDEAMRNYLWVERDRVMGSIVKYKYQPTGIKDKPRFPVFLGFRDERDM